MLAKICNTITAVLIAGLFGLVVILVGPRLLGSSTVSVISASMEPNIPVGSLVIVNEQATIDDIAPGDVITFTLGEETWATHRLMEVNRETGRLITKGDNNATTDGAVAFDRFVGKVVFGVPKLGRFATTIQSPQGIPLIGGFVVVMILLIFLPEIFKKEST